MWIGIGSIIMMFAGLTSAYIVKREQAGWVSFNLPAAFWISTGVILASSLALMLALKKFKEREIQAYRIFIASAFFLGVLFIIFQVVGFSQLMKQGITFTGKVSYSFLYVIVGIHALHVLGGVIALMVMFMKAFRVKTKSYNSVPLEVVSTYWHFVDILWIYLLIFLLMIK